MSKDMRIFVLVLAATFVISGIVGGQTSDASFSVVWAVVGPIVLGSIIIGLGAYFSDKETTASTTGTTLRQSLLDSYKHRYLDDTKCAICKRKGRRYALHVIEYYHADTFTSPDGFTPMSHSNSTVRGSIALCDACCPPCKKCSLPIASSKTNKLMESLSSQHPNITFRYGNGKCQHHHLFEHIKTLFKPKIRSKPVRHLEQEADSGELNFSFKSNPSDSMWGTINIQCAKHIQQALLDIWLKADLENQSDTNCTPNEVLKVISDIANEYSAKHGIRPAHVIIMAHQYIDADPLMRQLYRNKWVSEMVSRSMYAPPPEAYIKFVKATYFSA